MSTTSMVNVSCLICDDIRIEKNDKAILIGIYNDIVLISEDNWGKPPSVLPTFTIASFISNVEAGSKKVTWWIEQPNGKPFYFDEKINQDVKFEERVHRHFVQMRSVSFSASGEYIFHLEIGDSINFEKKFEVYPARKEGGKLKILK